MSLKDYRSKRDFRKTAEPKGSRTGAARKACLRHLKVKPSFVVHKHDASRLHYDLRLEMDGVLKSWAVPKGPSLNPRDKHLAVLVEDHPLEYKDFEGVIPAGEYGAGTVMIWDEGTYRVQGDEKAGEALERGELKIELRGKKLKGGWVLVRTRWRGEQKNWLLLKEKDDYAKSGGDISNEQPDSARSGHSMDQIAQEGS